MIDAAVKIITALTLGVINAIPVLIEKAPMIIESLVTTLIMLAPQLGVAALQMVISLANGILNNLPKIGSAAGSIVSTFIRGITDLKDKFVRIGGSIVDGVWSGIKSMYENFKANVLGFFTGIVDSVKKALGIHSPSTVFAGIGENMGKGLGVGFESSMEDVRRQMQAAMPGLEGAVSVNAAGGPIQSGGSGADLAAAVAAALNNAAVYMDQHKVGRLITIDQQSAARRGLIRV